MVLRPFVVFLGVHIFGSFFCLYFLTFDIAIGNFFQVSYGIEQNAVHNKKLPWRCQKLENKDKRNCQIGS